MGGHENLCDRPLFTGYTRDGGFATATTADARYAFPLGEKGDDVGLAPLLCAGLIGWRSLAIAGEGKNLGLYCFRAAARIVAKVASWQGARYSLSPGRVTSPCRPSRAESARLGLSDPTKRHRSRSTPRLSMRPWGDLVPVALKAVRKGGRVVCAGIHMCDVLSFPYRLLWEERQLVSVENLRRRDGLDFLCLARKLISSLRRRAIPLAAPMRRWPISAPVDLKAPPFSCHKAVSEASGHLRSG